MKSALTLKGVLTALATLFSFYLGGWDLLLAFLVWLVIFDTVFGLLDALFSHKTYDRLLMFKAAVIKLGYFILIMYAVWLDKTGMSLGWYDAPWARLATINYFIIHEGLSLIKHLINIGVPVPDFLKNAIEIFYKRSVPNG